MTTPDGVYRLKGKSTLVYLSEHPLNANEVKAARSGHDPGTATGIICKTCKFNIQTCPVKREAYLAAVCPHKFPNEKGDKMHPNAFIPGSSQTKEENKS